MSWWPNLEWFGGRKARMTLVFMDYHTDKQRVLCFTSIFGKSGVKRIALCLEIAIPVHKAKVKVQPVVRNGMRVAEKTFLYLSRILGTSIPLIEMVHIKSVNEKFLIVIDSSGAPGLTSGLQGSVNIHRCALLLVPQWQCISSFVFYI